MATQRIGGTAYLKVDGEIYALRGNLTVSPSVIERTGVAGQDFIHGFTEMPRIPWVEGDLSLVEELSIEDVEAMTDVTVTCELSNNKTYVLRSAWCRSAAELNTRDGQTRIRWEGMACDEF